jgi:hypothetical protein
MPRGILPKSSRITFRNKRVSIISWAPQSPDLNPIENLWKWIKDQISKQKHKIKTQLDIKCALRELWPNIPEDFLLKLCNSVPRRYEACLKNTGRATKY